MYGRHYSFFSLILILTIVLLLLGAPDLAFSLVRRLSKHLATRRRDKAIVARAAAAQAEYAKRLLKTRRNLDLVVFGHTHSHALESVEENRWYLNPGAWVDGHRYAVISQEGPMLYEFP